MPLSIQKSNVTNGGDNMVSNLPLLFAAGYPTSLEKITESQLEKFIPFMVQCSLGQIQISNITECSEPEWWPEDIQFSIPLRKSPHFSSEVWLSKLKEIVAICYQFHNSVFLLRFCENLSAYQPENLRFINNFNSTTSLFHRISNKLLVTFRNENMLYDQAPMNPKKTLLPRTHSSQAIETNQESMVEHAPFDIYLCDNCEAELYSLEAYREHEKYCQGIESEDDDVIFCGEEELEPKMQQANFLQNFQLTGTSTAKERMNKYINNNNNNFSINNNAIRDIPTAVDKAMKRVPRRSHVALTLSKCPTIAFSSPAGQHLIKTANGQMRADYHRERIERVERFCPAPILGYDGANRPKFMDKRPHYNVPITFRKSNLPYRHYTFPRRQFSTKSRQKSVEILQSILLKESHCRPLFIPLRRLTESEISKLQADVKSRYSYPPAAKIARRTRVIDFIDLCTSDEEEHEPEFIDVNQEEEEESLSNEATTPDSYGTKENINYDSRNIVQVTKGNKSIDLNSLKKKIGTTMSRPNCDSRPDVIQNLLSNHQSISVFKNKPLQHQNQDNNMCRYPNGVVNSTAEAILFGKHVASNEITITRRPSTVASTMQTNNTFVSIDLT